MRNSKLLCKLKNILTPEGVTDKRYFKYIGWSFVSTALVSMQTAMSTHSMLYAIGTEENRTENYIGKDVIGQLGGIAYMSKMGTKADKEPKKFMLYSNIIQQSSILTMSLTPLVDVSYFLVMAGGANALSNISFAGYGAINAKCIQKMSSDNMGEMYAKITMTNTIASTLGLSAGVVLCAYIPEHETRSALVPVLGLLRVYSYEKAIEDLI